jgi:hypothetical protein
MMGVIVPETCWADNKFAINYSVASSWLLLHVFHNDARSNSRQNWINLLFGYHCNAVYMKHVGYYFRNTRAKSKSKRDIVRASPWRLSSTCS